MSITGVTRPADFKKSLQSTKPRKYKYPYAISTRLYFLRRARLQSYDRSLTDFSSVDNNQPPIVQRMKTNIYLTVNKLRKLLLFLWMILIIFPIKYPNQHKAAALHLILRRKSSIICRIHLTMIIYF